MDARSHTHTIEHITSIQLEFADMRGGLLNIQRELEAVGKEGNEDPFGEKMGKFFQFAKDQMKSLTADVEQLAADNKDLIAWFASGKDTCIPTVVVEFCRDLEVRASCFVLVVVVFVVSLTGRRYCARC